MKISKVQESMVNELKKENIKLNKSLIKLNNELHAWDENSFESEEEIEIEIEEIEVDINENKREMSLLV